MPQLLDRALWWAEPETLIAKEGTPMCWNRTDDRAEVKESEKFATKKDEGEAFRTGKVMDTPKPLREETPRQMELADS